MVELKDAFNRVRLARHGKKQVLIEGILAFLSPSNQQGYKCNGGSLKNHIVDMEEVAKIIHDILRKMQGSAAPDGSKNKIVVLMGLSTLY